MSRGRLLRVIFVVTLMAVCAFAGIAKDKKDNQLYKDIDLYIEALNMVREKYVDADKTESRELVFDSLSGMVQELDPYSSFMDPQSFKDMREETRGEFGGLGIEIAIRDGWLTVIAPIEGTPADKAGIMAGDKIVKIDDESTEDITIMEAVHKLRGPKGTKVTVAIARAYQPDTIDISITRGTIKIQSVRGYLLRDGVGFVRISEFSQSTDTEFVQVIKKIRAEAKQDGGITGLVLDLRNNPGGLLMAAVELSDRLLSKDQVIVTTRGRVPESSSEYRARHEAMLKTEPLVVLVNKGSASASEILAGAVQDNKRGLILGEKTFGKASVQTIYALRHSEGPVAQGKEQGPAALRLTTAKYFTPKGRMIHEKGITPDIVVPAAKHTATTMRIIGGGYVSAFVKDYLARAEVHSLEQAKRIEVADETYAEFLKFMRLKEFVVEAEAVNPDEKYLRARIGIALAREELGETEARRLIIEKDPLTNQAIEFIKGHTLLRGK